MATSSQGMPVGLERQPSQQDLELARHLQNFHSQPVTMQSPASPMPTTRCIPSVNRPASSNPPVQEHHDLSDSLQNQDQMHPGPTSDQNVGTQQSRGAPNGTSPGGQMCR